MSSLANPEPKVVCVVDGIISNPGILLPWREMVTVCREEGVYSVVDAAHCIGQELNIDLESVQPDFWFSVCKLPSMLVRRISHPSTELSQMALRKAKLRGAIRPEEVRSFSAVH